jgi:hypothetical protein
MGGMPDGPEPPVAAAFKSSHSGLVAGVAPSKLGNVAEPPKTLLGSLRLKLPVGLLGAPWTVCSGT